MTRLVMAALAVVLLACGHASAQLSGSAPSPLGITSPLGIGPAAPVPGTGIPLGTTELGSVGVSPMTSGTSPLPPALTGTIATCAGVNSMAGNLSGTSTSTATSMPVTSGTNLFDGGGTVGTASGTCATGATSSSANPAASASSPTGMSAATGGRVGIPLDSTELGVGGVSPMPQIPTLNPSVPSSALLANPSGTSTTTSPCSAAGSGLSSGSIAMGAGAGC
jgi:hypothetical protein